MKFMKLVLAAAIAFGTFGIAAAPGTAEAQGRHSGEYRQDGRRHDAGRDDNRRGSRWDNDRGRHRGWENNRGRHRGWRNNPGRHRGWYNRRVCRTVWRHHQRQRVCRNVRYRR